VGGLRRVAGKKKKKNGHVATKCAEGTWEGGAERGVKELP
jgi:hypothetical protein